MGLHEASGGFDILLLWTLHKAFRFSLWGFVKPLEPSIWWLCYRASLWGFAMLLHEAFRGFAHAIFSVDILLSTTFP